MNSSLVKQWLTGAALLVGAALPLLAGADAGAQAQAQEAPAEAVAVTGTLEALIVEDFKHNQAEQAYFVHEHGGKRVHELDFKNAPAKSLRTGQRVTIKGHANGRKLQVDALTTDGGATSTSANAANEDLPPPDPERRTVVLLVDLLDATASTQYTLDRITSLMYTGTRSVAELYSQASLGQLHFVADSDNDGRADVFGPFTIDYSAAQNCDYHSWADAAENAAQQAGIDLTPYQHRIFVLPHYTHLPNCGWAGIATIGCTPTCRAWIADGDSGIVYAHELGHNLNLAHAGTDTDNDGVINQIYGDYSDPMGSSLDWHLFNAPHLDQMNWYANYPGSIVTVTQSGSYDIAVLDATPPTSPRILKLAKANNQGFYYLSYRQPTGYDDSLTPLYTRGVNIHRYQGSGYNPTAFITSLTDTGRFTDNASGIEITQVGHGDNYATVNINICARENPTVTLTPSSQAGKPGAALAYRVTVNNKDSAGCPATTFYLSYTGIGGGALVPASLSLQPGAGGSATLQLATAGFASNTYTVQVQATDGDAVAPIHPAPGTASATAVIDGDPPTTPTGLQGVATDQGIQLSWNAATDALTGVQSYTVYRDGTALGQTAVPGYTDTTTLPGTRYQYAVAATDGVGNVSPFSPPITVTSNSTAPPPGKCSAASPQVMLAPSSRAVQPGAAIDYTVTVDNPDSTACAPTTFTLRYAGAPAGAFTPANTLTLAGKDSGSATLQVNTTLQNGTLAEGSYTLEVRAADEDGGEPNHATVTDNTTLIVDGAPPTTPTGLSGSPTPQGTVQLGWNAATDALAGVRSYTVYRDGEAIASIASSGGLSYYTYTDTATTVGTTHRYAVAAVDKAGNSSPPSAPIQVFNGCEPANTTVNLTPSSQLIKAGASVNYAMTVNNADGSGCKPTFFVLNYNGIPHSTLASPWLLLNSGRSGSAMLTVATGAEDAILGDGSYTLEVQAADNDGAAPDHPTAGLGSATIIVDGTPPTTPANLQGATDAQGNITLKWNDSMDAPAGVQGYQVSRNGFPLGETTVPGYTDPAAAPNVNYLYTVVAIDKVGNVSPAAAISLGHGCWVAKPILTITPASLAVKKNAVAGYQVTLFNQDSGLQCSATTFTLSYSGTAAVTLTPTRLTLGAGQSGVATLQLNTAVTGAFTLTVQAVDGDGALPDHAAVTSSATAIVDGAAPTAPKGLQGAADAEGWITLTWNGSTDDLSGVQYYTIVRNNSVIDQATGPSYIDTSAVPGTTYKYAVSATDRAGNVSAKSPGVDVFDGCSPKNPTVTLAPSTQAVLPGVTAGYTVTLSNQDNTACTPTTFILSYKGSPSGALAATLPTLGPGQSDTTTLEVNKTSSGSFTLEVKAEDKDTVAPSHGPVTGKATFIVDGIAPTTPAGLQATTDPQGVIQLSWSAATDTLSGVKGYTVSRNSTVSRNGAVLAPQPTGLNYIDTTAAPGTTYQYTITATDNLGNVSSPATIELVSGCMVMNPTVTLTPLSNPLVKSGAMIDYEVTVSNQDGTAYCPATTFTLSYTGKPAASLVQTSLTLTGRQSGKTTLQVNTAGLASNNYTLKVQAADTDNAAPVHAAVTGSATCVSDDSKPTTPTGLKATASPGQIALTWTASTDTLSGVQGYSVYRNNVVIAETASPGYTDATTVKGTNYEYKVAARDGVGNVSASSSGVKVTGQ